MIVTDSYSHSLLPAGAACRDCGAGTGASCADGCPARQARIDAILAAWPRGRLCTGCGRKLVAGTNPNVRRCGPCVEAAAKARPAWVPDPTDRGL